MINDSFFFSFFVYFLAGKVIEQIWQHRPNRRQNPPKRWIIHREPSTTYRCVHQSVRYLVAPIGMVFMAVFNSMTNQKKFYRPLKSLHVKRNGCTWWHIGKSTWQKTTRKCENVAEKGYRNRFDQKHGFIYPAHICCMKKIPDCTSNCWKSRATNTLWTISKKINIVRFPIMRCLSMRRSPATRNCSMCSKHIRYWILKLAIVKHKHPSLRSYSCICPPNKHSGVLSAFVISTWLSKLILLEILAEFQIDLNLYNFHLLSLGI